MTRVWLPNQAAARRRSKRASPYYANISGTPFACLVLVFLMLFIGESLSGHHEGSVDWPRVQNARLEAGASRDDAPRINVTRDGKFYFRSTAANSAELPALIQTALHQGSERKVYIAADSRTKYGDVKILLDQIQRADVNRIAVLTTESAHQEGDYQEPLNQ